MKIYELPIINKDLISFHLEFQSVDRKDGERHFLEHMLLNSNETYTKDELRLELTKLGGGLFNACTSVEKIMLSGAYLKRDETRVWDLLRTVLNGALLKEDEIEKERKIILEEHRIARDNIFHQLYATFGECLNRPMTVIGNDVEIKAIGRERLLGVYNSAINPQCASLFVQNANVPTDLLKATSPIHTIEVIHPVGDYCLENSNMSSSVAFHTFNEKFNQSALLLSRYLNSVSGPLFKKIREELQLCYMVGSMTDFVGDADLSPYFTLYAVSNGDVDKASEALLAEFVVDDDELYDSLRKQYEIEVISAKNGFNGQMRLRRRSNLTGIPVDQLLENIPTFDEFKMFASNLKDKKVGSFIVRGTKK